jgi:hypothetical protein
LAVRSIEVLEEGAARPQMLSLFPEDRCEGLLADAAIVRVKLSELRLRRPRQWGACWLVLLLWRELQLDQFWSKRLGMSRKGTRWDQVLFALVVYRLLAPGSEWRLHREWFQRSFSMSFRSRTRRSSVNMRRRSPLLLRTVQGSEPQRLSMAGRSDGIGTPPNRFGKKYAIPPTRSAGSNHGATTTNAEERPACPSSWEDTAAAPGWALYTKATARRGGLSGGSGTDLRARRR